MTTNTTSAANYPTVSYGMQRFWDSPPFQWQTINTAFNVCDPTRVASFDAYLAHLLERRGELFADGLHRPL